MKKKTITLKDVAARAGVSYQTVSKVLNGTIHVTPETESRIRKAARALEYRPNTRARNLRTQSSRLIGYAWIKRAVEEYSPILDQFQRSLAAAAKLSGFHLLTFLIEGDRLNPEPYDELYAQQQVDGFVLADTNSNDPRIAYLMQQKIPFVSFGQANPGWHHCWVDVDGRQGIKLVVEHLLRRGHERIALLTWPEGSQAGKHREKGYLAALQSAGIAFDSQWMLRGDNSAEFGTQALYQLNALPVAQRPTAIACVNDLIAIGVLNAAASLGLRAGRDIAITGYDNAPLVQYLQPPLTSIRQPIDEAGRIAVDLLLAQIVGEPPVQEQYLLTPELIERESSSGLF